MEEQDIKKVWEQGFRKQQVNLSQEEINQIRKRKSVNLVGKIKGTTKMDHYATLFIIPVIIAVTFYFGYYWLGIVWGLAIVGLFIQNAILLRKLDKIELKDSTRDYLMEFRAFIEFMKKYSTRLLVFGGWIIIGPALLLGFQLAGPPIEVIFSPDKLVLSIVFLCVFLISSALIGVGAYRLVTKLMYGKKLKKIDEMIAELGGELR